MPLDPDRMGTAIAARVKALAPAPGDALTDNQLEIIWQAISDEIVKEIVTNVLITLAANDIPVSPGTFLDAEGRPITGKGENDPVALTGKIT